MAQPVHLLIVRAGGLAWGLPMDSVEQTFNLRAHRVHRHGQANMVLFRDETLEVRSLAEALELPSTDEKAAVIVWAGGRRQAFAVEELVGQFVLDRLDVPAGARGRFCSGIVLAAGDEVVPLLEPGAVAGAWGTGNELHFTEMQRSALLEIANIGSSHAATALSQLLGRPVEIGYSEALLTVLAEAIDRIGAPMSRSAIVDTPVAGDGGSVLLVFPDDAAEQLCGLLGTTLDDDMGRSALQEIGNILASSYLNAIVQLTGLELEPEPPSVEIDLLGALIARSGASSGNPMDPTVLMRSNLTIESSDARFSFLFVPRLGSVETLLEALGVGTVAPV
jgi:chemotaxis protein CheC